MSYAYPPIPDMTGVQKHATCLLPMTYTVSFETVCNKCITYNDNCMTNDTISHVVSVSRAGAPGNCGYFLGYFSWYGTPGALCVITFDFTMHRWRAFFDFRDRNYQYVTCMDGTKYVFTNGPAGDTASAVGSYASGVITGNAANCGVCSGSASIQINSIYVS